MPTEITPALAERVWDVVHGSASGYPTDVSTATKRLKLSNFKVFEARARTSPSTRRMMRCV